MMTETVEIPPTGERYADHLRIETAPGTLPPPSHPPMPPEIAKAIIQVMKGVEVLEKDSRNKFANYDYVSVDQFYELIGRKMAQAGIFLLSFEVSVEASVRETADDRGNVKKSAWLASVFDFYIYHETGAEFGPVRRTIQVPATGAQAYGSGMSYLEKYFLRSLFKIPTGDHDEDAGAKTGLPKDEPKSREPRQNGHSAEDIEKQATANGRAYIDSAKQQWAGLKTQAEMAAWWAKERAAFEARFRGPSDPLYVEFKTAFTTHGQTLPEGPVRPVVTSGPGSTLAANKPKDDIPGFSGDARPSESAIRMNFKQALVRTVTREDCNEAFILWVQPYEKSLSKPFVDEAYKLLQDRIDEVEK